MHAVRSSFMVRSAMLRGVCTCVLLVTAGLHLLPEAFGQGKSGPQKTFARPAEAAKALAAAAGLTTTTAKEDVYALFFDQKGLMAGLGVQGSKITRIEK